MRIKIVVAGVVSIIIMIVIGSLIWLPMDQHHIPYYKAAGNHVVLSDKIDKLSSEQQKDEMFNLARKALVKSIDKDQNVNWNDFEDISLYVEKLNNPHEYLLGYTIKSKSPMILEIRYNLVVKINVNDSRADHNNINVLDMKMSFTK